jgi:hypothetical protein
MFTLKDLISHLQITVAAIEKDPQVRDSNLEYILLRCADHVDHSYPLIHRVSMIDSVCQGLQVNQSVKDWTTTTDLLTQLDRNGFVCEDIYHLHDTYHDWFHFSEECITDKTDDYVSDFVLFFKMLRSLGYKVHF